ncbi:MAG: MFS transporter [Planctomycetes bacterium]|jgi:MFS family permease|nr:MFS transporter [Planctomycetota bacterium]
MLAAATTLAFDDPLVLGVLGGMGIALVLVLWRELRNVPKRLLVLMAAAFLDMVGLFMVVPILPFYVQSLGRGGASVFGMALGEGQLTALVISAFTIAQLISAPWWGRLSDRKGRRPVLLIALSASAIAFLVFGFADSLWLLVLSRVVQGAGGGTVGVIQAYVADAVDPSERARALGWLSAATNLGVALGPVLGSGAAWLGQQDLWPGDGALQLGRSAPGLFAALLCLLNVFFAFRYLPESKAPPVAGAPAAVRVRPLAAIGGVLARPGLPASRLLLIYAIAIGAAQGVNPTMVLLLGERFGATETSIGYLFMYIGSLSVFARVLLLGRAVDRLGEPRLLPIGLLLLSIGLAGLPLASGIGSLALVVALLPLGMALTFPCLTSMLSRVVPAADRGLYMGLQQTFGGVSRLLAPLAYGYAWDRVSRPAPFWLAGGVVFVTLGLCIGLARHVPAKSVPSSKSG